MLAMAPKRVLYIIVGATILLPVAYQWGAGEIFYIQILVFASLLMAYLIHHRAKPLTILDHLVATYVIWCMISFFINVIISMFTNQIELNSHRALSFLTFLLLCSPYLIGRYYFSNVIAVKDYMKAMLIGFGFVLAYFFYAIFQFGLDDLVESRIVMAQRLPMLICFVGILAGVLAVQANQMRAYLLLLWVASSILVALSLTRAVYVQWLVCMCVLLFIVARRYKFFSIILVSLFVIVAVSLYSFPGVEEIVSQMVSRRVYPEQMVGGGKLDESSSLRILMWNELLERLSENPLRWIFGYGQLGPGYIGLPITSEAGINVSNYSAHNDYLDIMIRSGGVGLVLVLLILLTVIHRGFQVSRQSSNSFFAIYLAHSVALTGVIFYGFFHETLRYMIFGMYFWFYAGVVSSNLFTRQSSKPSR